MLVLFCQKYPIIIEVTFILFYSQFYFIIPYKFHKNCLFVIIHCFLVSFKNFFFATKKITLKSTELFYKSPSELLSYWAMRMLLWTDSHWIIWREPRDKEHLTSFTLFWEMPMPSDGANVIIPQCNFVFRYFEYGLS